MKAEARHCDGPTDCVGAVIGSLAASAENGDRTAADALFVTLYGELRKLARSQLARNAAPITLGPTTLLHEAYLDIAGRESVVFPDRGRFMAYAARVMRGLIIDHARHRKTTRRGGEYRITALEDEVADPADDPAHLERIGTAIDELAGIDPLLAQVVDLRFFCGFTFAEIALMRAVTERTVQRHWEKARLYLHALLRA
ncbi:MAG: ECF-type sigma factor [Vicinamibacteria bacterium]